MDYYKKVVVLKEVEQGYSCGDKPINAIARLEVESDIADLYVSVINITGAVTGEYTLFLYDQSTLYHFDLGKRPLSFRFPFSKTPNLSNGFCVGIFYVENYIPVLVAFAKTENCQTDRIVFKKKVADKCLTRLKESQRQEIEELSKITEPLCEQAYNDEAVATENYFTLDEDISVKLEKLKELENEPLSVADDYFNCPIQKEERESKEDFVSIQDEKNFTSSQKQADYYLTVKDELEQIFLRFEKEVTLCNIFENSKWSKINYSKDKYYVVGLIHDNNQPRYICYGVPDDYSPTPPKELAGFCVFVPINKKYPKSSGYWMMFQDAHNGRCVTDVDLI